MTLIKSATLEKISNKSQSTIFFKPWVWINLSYHLVHSSTKLLILKKILLHTPTHKHWWNKKKNINLYNSLKYSSYIYSIKVVFWNWCRNLFTHKFRCLQFLLQGKSFHCDFIRRWIWWKKNVINEIFIIFSQMLKTCFNVRYEIWSNGFRYDFI